MPEPESEPATAAHGPEPAPHQVCGRYLRLLRDEGATLWQSCTLADPNPNRSPRTLPTLTLTVRASRGLHLKT